MSKNNGKRAPTATVTPSRLRVFQPSQRPTFRTGEWSDIPNRGRCRVTGRLGQRHADLVSCMLYSALWLGAGIGGAIEMIVDPAAVRRMMSKGTKCRQYSFSAMEKLLKELHEANVELDSPSLRIVVGGHLVESVLESNIEANNPLQIRKNKEPELVQSGNPSSGKRKLWLVRLGEVMTFLLYNDIKLYYDPTPIAALQNGISQAVARYLLSHRNQPTGGWIIDNAITAVAGEMSATNMRHRRRELHEDTKGLYQVGFIVTVDRLVRVGDST